MKDYIRTTIRGGVVLCVPPKDMEELRAAISLLEAKLEIEQMRLVACSVVSLANTPESAAQARDMHPDYRSFACDDVARMVDREIEHRATISRLRDALTAAAEQRNYLSSPYDTGWQDAIRWINQQVGDAAMAGGE